MKTVIWDLDGTIIDSYNVIVPAVCEALNQLNIYLDKEYVADYIIKYSCGDLFAKMAKERNISLDVIKNSYASVAHIHDDTIGLIPNAREILEILNNRGINNIIYTHRGESTADILKRNNIDKYFFDVINSTYNFKRKPDPEGLNYIIEKYHLDKKDVVYIGDRSIDMECAKKANICGILFATSSSGYENYLIDSLLKIEDIIIQK